MKEALTFYLSTCNCTGRTSTSGVLNVGEQNWLDVKWPEGQRYSRRLKVNVVDGALSIADDLVLGWILVGKGAIQDRICKSRGFHHFSLSKERHLS